MIKVFRKLLILCLVFSIVFGLFDTEVKASTVKQTELSEYALSFDGNKNIPYVWGGGRGSSVTLEGLASKPPIDGHPNGTSCTKKGRCGKCCATGTDCSGFTSLVYKHFGISITAQSGEQYSEAKKRFTDIDEAVPGDITWWEGHVGIYIGESKIIHTNSTYGPTNFPHVSIITKDQSLLNQDGYYKYPTYFLRMVDDINDLKPLSGSSARKVNDKVRDAIASGSMVTESDLTGMIIEDTLLEGDLPEISELSDSEMIIMDVIRSDIQNRDLSIFETLRVAVVFLGLLAIIYGILLGVAYLFDRTNNLLEISLLAIMTLGRYRLWDEDYGVKPGYNKRERIMYCNSGIIIKRMIIIEAVGFLLIGGFSRFL